MFPPLQWTEDLCSLRDIPVPTTGRALEHRGREKKAILRTRIQARKCDDPMCVVTFCVPELWSKEWTFFWPSLSAFHNKYFPEMQNDSLSHKLCFEKSHILLHVQCNSLQQLTIHEHVRPALLSLGQ